MEVATHHSKSQRVTSRINMKERLLLDRIALDSSDVTKRHTQLAALIESNPANASLPLANKAAMTACNASDTRSFYLPERTYLCPTIQ
jgi:hypothetical protein